MRCNKTVMGMAKTFNNFEINLPQELNLWAVRVFTRIKRKFAPLHINMSANPKKGFTGDLYRTMYWQVFNAAGGNTALITFFYLKYGDFVQWGVGRGQKAWPIPATGGDNIPPIKAPDSNRHAKLFLRREVRYHATWLQKRLLEEYGFASNLYMVRGFAEGMGDSSITDKWINDNKDLLTQGFLDLMNIK